MNDNERLSVAQTVYLGHHSNNKDMHYILYYIISISNVFLLQLTTVRMDMHICYTCIVINFAQGSKIDKKRNTGIPEFLEEGEHQSSTHKALNSE